MGLRDSTEIGLLQKQEMCFGGVGEIAQLEGHLQKQEKDLKGWRDSTAGKESFSLQKGEAGEIVQ